MACERRSPSQFVRASSATVRARARPAETIPPVPMACNPQSLPAGKRPSCPCLPLCRQTSEAASTARRWRRINFTRYFGWAARPAGSSFKNRRTSAAISSTRNAATVPCQGLAQSTHSPNAGSESGMRNARAALSFEIRSGWRRSSSRMRGAPQHRQCTHGSSSGVFCQYLIGSHPRHRCRYGCQRRATSGPPARDSCIPACQPTCRLRFRPSNAVPRLWRRQSR